MRTVITPLAAMLLAALPLVAIRTLGDPYQAPRAAIAMLALAMIALLPTRSLVRIRSVKMASVAGFLALLGVASAATNHFESSLWGVHGRFQGLMWLLACLIALIVGMYLRGAFLSRLVDATAATGAIAVAITVSAVLSKSPLSVISGNTAIAGAWLAVACGVTAAGALSASDQTRRTLLFAACAVIALGTVSTGSRGAIVGASAAVAACMLAARAGRRVVRIVVAAMCVVLLVGLIIAGPGSWQKLTPQALASGSVASRVELWRASIAIVQAHPFLGVGPGRFLYVAPSHTSLAYGLLEGVSRRPDQAHNLVLQFASEMGVLSAIMLVLLLAWAIMGAWNGARARDGGALIALGAVVAYGIVAMVGVASIETDVIGWLAMGAAIARGATADVVSSRRDAGIRAFVLMAAIGGLIACSVFISSDLQYARGLAAFQERDFATADRRFRSAVSINPYTDNFRVAVADAGLYATDGARRSALVVVEDGLVLEPDSYDLALARARLLRALGDSPWVTAKAFDRALALNPLGSEVLGEAITSLRATGGVPEAARADRLERRLSALVGTP